MTLCQTIAIDYEDEMKNTRKLLERVPLDDAHRNYKPHAKSMSLEALASHVAEIPSWTPIVFAGPVFELDVNHKQEIARTTEDLLKTFDKGVEQMREAIVNATDAEMNKDWTFKYGEMAMTSPRTKVVRSFIDHLIHHRAQLGVYLRLNNVAIPGMYGPSADEMPM